MAPLIYVGYWQIAIHPDDRKFLGIHIVDEDGHYKFYQWNVLYLGLSSAVHLFTMVLKPARIYIQSLGIRTLFYIDDTFFVGKGELNCKENRDVAINVLKSAGFIISEEKSKNPSPRLEFLGLEVCSTELSFFIPERKLLRIEQGGNNLLRLRKVQLRDAARWIGLLISCSKAIGPTVRLRTRNFYCWLNRNVDVSSYNHHFPLDEESREEVEFWVKSIRNLNGYSFTPELTVSETRYTVVTDASSIGCFGFMIEDKYQILARRKFSAEEFKSSSTARELLALEAVYTSDNTAGLEGNVLHLTDNQAVCVIMEVGSKKPSLMKIVMNILRAAKEKNIKLRCEWRPRDHYLIQHADLGSRSFDDSAISLNFESFLVITEFFADFQFDVDCMAQEWNKKANIFYSKLWEEGSAGINFFSQKLNPSLSHYCFPPVSKIIASILHLAKCKVANGLLVVPVWKSCSFWVSILPDGKHFPKWVTRFLRFKPTGFIVDEMISANTYRNPVNYEIVVLQFCFQYVNNQDDLYTPYISVNNCFDFGCNFCRK